MTRAHDAAANAHTDRVLADPKRRRQRQMDHPLSAVILMAMGRPPPRPSPARAEGEWSAAGYPNRPDFGNPDGGTDLTKPSEAMRKIDAVFDGEILAFDSKGRPDFRRLQHRMHVSPRRASRLVSEIPARYYVFDLLWLEGRSLLDESYFQRRRLLESLELSHDRWQVPATHPREGPAMLRVARKWGLEGVMAKRRDSPYRPGTRSRDWLKIKIVKRQEFVVGGWEPRAGNDRQVGALLLGYYDPDTLGLRYAGRVGTGFDAHMHEMLVPLLVARERKESPFSEDISERGTRFLDPKLVADVEYRRWPLDGHLQQASFMGLRDDVAARNVVIERGGRRT